MSELVTRRAELAEALEGARRAGQRVGLVPTMGALHAGHGALLAEARAANDVVVCSLFVNPLQFGDPTDLAAYPRDLAGDLALLGDAGADLCFAPSVEEIYPDGAPETAVDPGPIAAILEGASRPGHFRAVATVVAKLLALCAPARAYFGEKDYQQLVVVRRLVRDLSFPVEVVGCPTVREADGLALSSRNRRLSATERAAAPVLFEALRVAAGLLGAGERDRGAIEAAMAAVVAREPLAALDYAVARDAPTLEAREVLDGEIRLLVAARIGEVRLIDNLGAHA